MTIGSLRMASMALQTSFLAPPPPETSLSQTVLSVAVNIAGAGLLFIPLSLHQTSLIPGIFLIVLCGVGTVLASDFIVGGMELTGATTLPDVFARIVMGPDTDDLTLEQYHDRIAKRRKLSAVMDVMIAMYSLCVLAMYAQIITDSLVAVAVGFALPEPWHRSERYEGICFFLLLIPSSFRFITELSWSNALAVITLLMLSAAVLFEYLSISSVHEHFAHSGVRWFDSSAASMLALPTITVALGYHYNVPQMYKEMTSPTPLRFHRATVTATVLSIALYVIVGVSAYLTFGNEVALADVGGNVMNNYPSGSQLLSFVRLATAAHVAFVFPMNSIAVRDAIHRLTLRLIGEHDAAEDPFVMLMTPRSVIVMEAALVCAAALLSPTNELDIGFFVNVIGSVFGIFVIFMAPAIMGIAISTGMWRESPVFGAIQELDEYTEILPSEGRMLTSLAILTAGVFAVITSLMGMLGLVSVPDDVAGFMQPLTPPPPVPSRHHAH
jgi:amino acid permease